ncbi:MAG: hypothetical protein HY696_02140 [Deltaproteobacteria bacterium]|nr:hypothetical protein [Deltaproteobacteria bacterium]
MPLFSKRGYQPMTVRTALETQPHVGNAAARREWLGGLDRAQGSKGQRMVAQIVSEARAEGLQLAPLPARWAGLRRWQVQRCDAARLFEMVLHTTDPWTGGLALDEVVRQYQNGDRVAVSAVKLLLEDSPFSFARSGAGQQLFATLVAAAATQRNAAMQEQHRRSDPGPAELDELAIATERALLTVVQDGYRDVRSVPLLQAIARTNPLVIGMVYFTCLIRTAVRFPTLLDAVGTIAQARSDLGVMLLEASEFAPTVHSFLTDLLHGPASALEIPA